MGDEVNKGDNDNQERNNGNSVTKQSNENKQWKWIWKMVKQEVIDKQINQKWKTGSLNLVSLLNIEPRSLKI